MGDKISSSWWGNILLYGLSLGLLMAALRFSQFRLLTLGVTDSWYTGLVAMLFALLGIWTGRKLTRQKPPNDNIRVSINTTNPAVLEKLGITPRELQVLEHMAQGLSNQEIADKLFVSLNTVKTHTSKVFSKLNVQRRTQAIQVAKELKILS